MVSRELKIRSIVLIEEAETNTPAATIAKDVVDCQVILKLIF